MKKVIWFVLVCLLNVNLFAAAEKTNVLFIGNSITYFNDMPETFEAIANSLGDSTDITMYAPGGTGFANHVADENVYSLFRQGNWDYIVLQPGTGDSGGEAVGGTPIETSLLRIKTLLDSAYMYSPCAQVLFYEISNGVVGDSSEDVEHYNNTMDLIRSNVEFFADSTFLPFAPVGEAFRTSWNNNQNLLLWNSFNDIHPNSKGSYLAACTFYATIFQNPCSGSTVCSDLTVSEAEYFQQLADFIVLNHFDLWNINVFTHANDFYFEGSALEFQFTSQAQNYDSLMWDFGDGYFSDEENPYHIFSSAGNYTVSLSSWKNGCLLTSSQSIVITDVINNDLSAKIMIYPNPVVDRLHILDQDKHDVRYSVYDLSGSLLMQGVSDVLNVSNWPSGVYVLHLERFNTIHKVNFVKM